MASLQGGRGKGNVSKSRKASTVKDFFPTRTRPGSKRLKIHEGLRAGEREVSFENVVAVDCQFSLPRAEGDTTVEDEVSKLTSNRNWSSWNFMGLPKGLAGEQSTGSFGAPIENNNVALEVEIGVRDGDGTISRAETVIIDNSELNVQDRDAELDDTLKDPSSCNDQLNNTFEKTMPPLTCSPFVNVDIMSSMPSSSQSNLDAMDLSKKTPTKNADQVSQVIDYTTVQEPGSTSSHHIPDLEVFLTGFPNNADQNRSRTILSLEMKNFMGFTNKTVEFGNETNLLDATGKSTVIIGLMLALGQDEILEAYGYEELKDVIKIGQPIAILNLQVVIRRKDFGATILVEQTVWIKRKIQVEDGRLLEPIWKLKSGVDYVPISKNIIDKNVIPSLNIVKWMSGVPIIITRPIIWKCLERTWKFWFQEYKTIKEAVSLQKDDKMENLKETLINRKRFLRETKELHQSNIRDVFHAAISRNALLDMVTEKDSISKLELGIKTMEDQLEVMLKSHEERQAGFDKSFVSRYSALSAAIGLQGQCIIDLKSGEIVCAVAAKLDCCQQKDQLKKQYAASSLKYKSLAVGILIVCFWEEMPKPAFFIVDGISNEEWLKQLVDSKEFKKLLHNKHSQQFILG